MPDAALELHTLSGARLTTDSGTELLGPGKPLAFLIYLACSPRQTASREHLIDLLWSDLPAEKARHALRQTLWYLRQLLPEGLRVSGSDVLLVTPLRLDRDEFLREAAADHLERAVTIYQHEFLNAFAVPGGLEFEHWAEIERQQLSAVFLRVVEQLCRRYLDAGRFAEAIALARRARDAAPASERTWRLLLEALVAGQDPIGFALEGSALRTRLQQEGRAPEPLTATLLERMDGNDLPTAAGQPRGLHPGLVGRSAPFALILAEWEEARQQRGRHLHLRAGPGLGKSRLLDDVYHRFRGRGARVVQVRATPGDRTIPYSLAAEIARALAELPGASGISPGSASTLVALNPSLSNRYAAHTDSATGPEAARRRSAALLELLTAVSEEQPVALLVDDLHWTDPASLQCLQPLFERLHAVAALVVTAARPVVGLEGIESGQTLTLPPLTRDQVTELLVSLGPLPDAPWAGELPVLLHQNSGGVPLLLLETLELAKDRGTLLLTAAGWECPDWPGLRVQLERESGLRQRVADLGPEPARALLALAVAGQPLCAAEVARMLAWDEGSTERALTHLERRGLAHQAADQWQPAHDEIAALSLERSEEGARRALHRALGEMLAGTAAAPPRDLVRAGRHLVLAEHWSELREVFLRYVRRRRREGDHRRVRFLAMDFLEGMPQDLADRLLTRLGRLNRLRYEVTRPLLVGALAVVATVGFGLSARPRTPEPDTLLLLRDPNAPRRSSIIAVPLSLNGWHQGEPIDLLRLPRTSTPGRDLPVRATAIRPGGNLWAVTTVGADSVPNAATEVMLYDLAGHARPLATGPADDNTGSWLADGSGVVITTGRWAADGYYDIAVQPLEGAVRRVTATAQPELGGLVSPDGTRIAFERPADPAGTQICTIGLDGADEACAPFPRRYNLVGWADVRTLVTSGVGRDGLRTLEYLSLDAGTTRAILDDVEQASVSPDARWIVYDRLPPGRSDFVWFVAPAAAPTEGRELLGLRRGELQLLWQVNHQPPYVDRLVLRRPTGSIPSHTVYRLVAEALDQQGRRMGLTTRLHWTSSDTSVAVVDSLGILRPRREGMTTITVAIPGWRTDTATIAVRQNEATTVFEEDWTHGLDGWVPFGDPLPTIVERDSGKRAFWNRGDGSFISGAYTRAAWPGSRGFGIEVMVSTRITETHWQQAMVQVVGGLDSTVDPNYVALNGTNRDRIRRICEISLPVGEGASRMELVALGAAGLPVQVPMPDGVAGGRWLRTRIQVFPDGTCGMALDGKPVWRSRVPIMTDLPFGILLGLSSHQTRVLHGDVTAWTGVRDDVDWPSLGMQAARVEPAGVPH